MTHKNSILELRLAEEHRYRTNACRYRNKNNSIDIISFSNSVNSIYLRSTVTVLIY
jgi:ssRNA-specific RNase YbeY (16S rRNA maturation enzyme)